MTDKPTKSPSQTTAAAATHGLGPELEKPAAIRENLKHLDRRQWWLGSTTVAVVMLLTLCVASFAFPGILDREETTYSFFLNQAVHALVGLVLIFNVYLIYQQFQITKLRSELGTQIDSLAKVESLASEVYKLAALDQLTGLYNRRSGEQRLAEEMSRAQRHGRPLDNFVNGSGWLEGGERQARSRGGRHGDQEFRGPIATRDSGVGPGGATGRGRIHGDTARMQVRGSGPGAGPHRRAGL